MFKKEILALSLLLFVMLFAVSSVSAAENVTDDFVCIDETNEDACVDQINNEILNLKEDDLDKINHGDEILSSNEKDIISVEENSVLSRNELHVAIYHTSMYFGESEQIKMFIMPINGKYDFDLKISDMGTGSVLISKNFKGTATDSFDKYYTIPVGALDIGRYYMGVYRKSDGYKMDNAFLDVNAINSPITAKDTTIYYGSGGNIHMTVKPSYLNCKYDFHVEIRDLNNNLVMKGPRMYSFKPTTSVKYNIAPASLKPGQYYVYIVNTGSDFADDCILKVLAKKATPKLIAAKKIFKNSAKTKKYTITLKNNIGVAMKNTKVTIKVNKKTYTAKTNSKGVATFKLTKLAKKGKYAAVVKFAGNKYYKGKTVKTIISVK